MPFYIATTLICITAVAFSVLLTLVFVAWLLPDWDLDEPNEHGASPL